MTRIETDTLAFHLVFGAVASAAILAPASGVALGVRVLGLLMLYNVGLPLVARWRGHDLWMRIWAFVLPISILQIVPDWFLAEVVGSLVFNAPGLVQLGAVPLYMGLMWTIPLFLVVFVGVRTAERRPGAGYLGAIITGLLLFGGAEYALPHLHIWEPVDVRLVAGIAAYIFPAELALSAVTFAAWNLMRERSAGQQVMAAFVVMTSYLGAACACYLFVEAI